MRTKKNYWIGLAVLLAEVAFFILLMVFVAPLKEMLPVYAILVAFIAVGSLFLVKISKKTEKLIPKMLFAFTAGMIWWTMSEMNAEAFQGSGIENQAGLFLLVIAVLALSTFWKDINTSSKIAVGTFMTNWVAHMIIKMLCHMRNPIDPRVCLNPMNAFNVIGFAYGIFSAVAVIAIFIKVITKGVKEERVPYYALVSYALILNLLYIFVKGYFVLG